MLENKKKKEEYHGLSVAAITLEKSRLHQARTLAYRRKDHKEVAELDKKIALLTGRTSQTHSPAPPERETAAQREQRTKIENLRKAEQVELERRRKERKERLLAAEAEGTATPPLDRLKGSSVAASRFVCDLSVSCQLSLNHFVNIASLSLRCLVLMRTQTRYTKFTG